MNDLILFQDNDVLLLSDTAERLVRHLHDFPDALLVSPRVVYADNPGTVQYDSADCHFLGLMATRNADVPVYNLGASPCETTSMVSACFLINRARWNGESLFDESFGFNLEDHDFGLRARLAGHSLWVQPQAVVRHGTGTPGLSYRPGGAASEQRLYFLTLNRWIVITKCYAGKTLAVLAPALLLFELMQFAWLAGQGRFRVWSRAMRGYWQARRRVYADRLLVQSSRCIPDAAILRDSPLPVTDRVRGGVLATALVAAADSLLRGYWHLVRRLL